MILSLTTRSAEASVRGFVEDCPGGLGSFLLRGSVRIKGRKWGSLLV